MTRYGPAHFATVLAADIGSRARRQMSASQRGSPGHYEFMSRTRWTKLGRLLAG